MNLKMVRSLKEAMVTGGVEKLRGVLRRVVCRGVIEEGRAGWRVREFGEKRRLAGLRLYFDYWGYVTEEKVREEGKMERLYQRIVKYNWERQKVFKLM